MKKRAVKAGVETVMRSLARAIDGLELPAVEKISESQQEDPFQVLIATLLSARTQDATTLAASTRLFKAARTPAEMARLTVRRIERLARFGLQASVAQQLHAACSRRPPRLRCCSIAANASKMICICGGL